MNNLAVALTATAALTVVFVVGALPIGVSVSSTWEEAVSEDAVQATLSCDSQNQRLYIGVAEATNTLPIMKRVAVPGSRVCLSGGEPYQYNPIRYGDSYDDILSVNPGSQRFNLTVDLSCRGGLRPANTSQQQVPSELVVTNSDSCDNPDVIARIPVRE